MPRGSQSSRKQPAFDPRELEDLIFSPAVGTGVSSHLLDTSATDQFPFPSDPSRSLVAADIHSSLEDPSNAVGQPSELEATASRTLVSAIPTKPLADEELPSEIDMATVDMSSSATVDINTTVDMYELPTVAISKLTTVEAKDPINGEAHRRAQIVAMSTVVDSDVSTVVFNDLATVQHHQVSTVDMSHFLGNEESDSSAIPVSTVSVADRRDETEPLPMATLRLTDTDKGSKSAYPKNQLAGDPEVTTVDTYAGGTVDSINLATVDTLKSTTLPTSKAMTVGKSDSNPFRATAGPETLPYRGELHLWVTEDGALVAQSRVKRIRIAQDVINSAEESVYDTLWNTKFYPSEQGSGDSSRVVQAGYDYLMKRTRLSKKTVQRIIDRLINKDFIAIERPADIYRRLPTVYRVFDYRAVLVRHSTKGRTHVAKIGPGFTYAYPVDDPRVQRVAPPTTPHQDLTTVVQIDESTVVTNELPTEAKGSTVTGAKQGATTVVCETTKYIDKNSLSHSSASTSVAGSLEDSAAMPTTAAIPNELIPRLQNLVNFIDNDAIALLWNECRLRAADCTVEEVLYFAEGKAAVCASGRIKNPIGFLLTAVPKCFEGPAFVGFRKEQQRKQEEERRRQQREQERQKQLEEQGREEAEAYERGKQKLEALALDQYKALYEKTKEDFLARYPNALRSAPKTIEELVQQQMIRNLQD